MRIRCAAFVGALLLTGMWAASAAAQAVPPPAPSLRDTVFSLTDDLLARPAGEAIGLATALEVANAPFGSSAGGFVFKLDPATGLKVRTAPTFGPSFAERALTAGEGRVSFGASLTVATYDKLNDFSLKRMELVDARGPGLRAGHVTGYASLVLSSETFVVSTAIGATDNLDITVAVPFVKVKLNGISWLEAANPSQDVVQFNRGEIESSGLGDVAVGAKLRLVRFGEGPPDPGGISFQLLTRVPTGRREQFRGLGITRVLGSVLISGGTGRLRPHANVGFDWWEKSLEVVSDYFEVNRVGARHQLQYAAGVELEASPKVTLLIDFLGRHILGGGAISLETAAVPPEFARDVTGLEAAVATTKGIRKWTLAPGLKWNLKGNFVFSGNALIALKDRGLHDRFTPVFGLDLTF